MIAGGAWCRPAEGGGGRLELATIELAGTCDWSVGPSPDSPCSLGMVVTVPGPSIYGEARGAYVLADKEPDKYGRLRTFPTSMTAQTLYGTLKLLDTLDS